MQVLQLQQVPIRQQRRRMMQRRQREKQRDQQYRQQLRLPQLPLLADATKQARQPRACNNFANEQCLALVWMIPETWACATNKQFAMQAVAVAIAKAT